MMVRCQFQAQLVYHVTNNQKITIIVTMLYHTILVVRQNSVYTCSIINCVLRDKLKQSLIFAKYYVFSFVFLLRFSCYTNNYFLKCIVNLNL